MWWLWFLAFAAISVVWSLSTAMMGAPDEPAHAIKAVAVVRGEFGTAVESRTLGAFGEGSLHHGARARGVRPLLPLRGAG